VDDHLIPDEGWCVRELIGDQKYRRMPAFLGNVKNRLERSPEPAPDPPNQEVEDWPNMISLLSSFIINNKVLLFDEFSHEGKAVKNYEG